MQENLNTIYFRTEINCEKLIPSDRNPEVADIEVKIQERGDKLGLDSLRLRLWSTGEAEFYQGLAGKRIIITIEDGLASEETIQSFAEKVEL